MGEWDAYDPMTGQGTNVPDFSNIGDTDPSNQGFPGDAEQGAYSGLDNLAPNLAGVAGAALPFLLPQGNGAYPIYGQQGVQPAGLSIGGPNGINLGTSAMPSPVQPLRSSSGRAGIVRNILAAIAGKLGFRLKARAAVDLIVKFGPGPLGIDANSALILMAARRGRSRRGPHLYTVQKQIRLGHRRSQQIAKMFGRGGHHARRARPNPFKRRRKK